MIVEAKYLFDNIFMKRNNLNKINNKSAKYRDFKKNYNVMSRKLVYKFADNINKRFIEDSLKDRRNKLLVYSIDNNDIDFYNIAGVILCRKTFNSKDKIRYIILIIAIYPKVRGVGFGTIILEELSLYLYKKNKILEMILHSLATSYNFYLKNGFRQIERNSFLERYENVDSNDFILMKLSIKNI